MKSKIINRIRDRQEDVQRYRFRVLAAQMRLDRERMQHKPSIDLSEYVGTYGGYQQDQSPNRQWWQFWKWGSQ